MIRVSVAAAVSVVLLSVVNSAPVFGFEYSGDEGPANWHELDAGFANCGLGINQSPIDIQRPIMRDIGLGALQLDLHDTEVHLENNGHTIEQVYEAGSTLTFGGVTYELLQFHFHTLAEHTIGGKRHPMEMHAVFRDAGTGNLAVIGQLFKIDRHGLSNAFLDAFDDNLPPKAHDEFESATHINLADGLKNTRSYFTYPGSLTTPPCSPIVTWLVLHHVATMSQAQYDAFRDIMGNNFRPTQERGARTIRRGD